MKKYTVIHQIFGDCLTLMWKGHAPSKDDAKKLAQNAIRGFCMLHESKEGILWACWIDDDEAAPASPETTDGKDAT